MSRAGLADKQQSAHKGPVSVGREGIAVCRVGKTGKPDG